VLAGKYQMARKAPERGSNILGNMLSDGPRWYFGPPDDLEGFRFALLPSVDEIVP
jgi:hypothetical protein